MLNNAAGKQGARGLHQGVLADTHSTLTWHSRYSPQTPRLQRLLLNITQEQLAACSRAGIFQLVHMLWIISFIFSGHKLLYFLITADEIPLPKRAKLCTFFLFPRNILHISCNIKPKYFRIAPPWSKVFQ